MGKQSTLNASDYEHEDEDEEDNPLRMIKITAGSSVRILGQLGMDLTRLTVNFLFEQADAVSADSAGFVVALAGSQVQTRSAVVVGNPSLGQAAYVLTSTDTMTPGRYRAQFQVSSAEGPMLYFPAQDWIWFDVADFVAPTTYSALVDFYEPVRAVMGDFRRPFKFEDASLASVVRSMVRTGKIGPRYTISPDALSVQPAVIRVQDLAALTYWSARTLLGPQLRGESWATRGLKARRNDQRDFLFEMENILYDIENPTQMASFQSYYSWVNSLAGINVWGLMTEMKVEGPVATAIIGTGGIQINTT
jgi:hypothetical protein